MPPVNPFTPFVAPTLDAPVTENPRDLVDLDKLREQTLDWAKQNKLLPEAGKDMPSLPKIELVDNQKEIERWEKVLREAAPKHISDPARRQLFLDNMKTFEDRAKSSKMYLGEVVDTFKKVALLFNTSWDAINNAHVAEEVMRYAAHPDQIDQGMHPTCGVATVEEVVFAKRPSVAASMIVAALFQRPWKSPDGVVVQIKDKESVQPGFEEQRYPTRDGERSYASQLFQTMALNDIGKHSKHEAEFVEKHPHWNWVSRLYHAVGIETDDPQWSSNGQFVRTFDGLTDKQIGGEANRLTGRSRNVLVYNGEVRQNGEKVQRIYTREDLRNVLDNAQKIGRLPLIVAVNGYDDVFYTGWFGPHNNHVVSVEKYDPTTDSVYVSNQWGSEHDKWMKTDQLYKAMCGQ